MTAIALAIWHFLGPKTVEVIALAGIGYVGKKLLNSERGKKLASAAIDGWHQAEALGLAGPIVGALKETEALKHARDVLATQGIKVTSKEEDALKLMFKTLSAKAKVNSGPGFLEVDRRAKEREEARKKAEAPK